MINALRRVTMHQAIVTIVVLGVAVVGSSLLLMMISPIEASILLIATAVSLVIIWRPEIGLLLMIASLGFEAIVIGAPVTIFRMIGILTFGSWLSRELLSKRLSIVKAPQNLYMAGFIFTAILSMFFADVIGVSLLRIFTLIQLTFLYLLVIGIVNSEQKLRQVVWVWVISAVAASLLAIATFIWKELPRAIGGIGDPNYLVLYLLIPVALSGCLFQMEKSTIRRVFVGISLGIFLAVTVISFSRGGFIAIMAVLLLMFLKTRNKRKFVALLLAFSIIALALPPTVLPLQAWFDRLAISVALEDAGAGRFYIWRGGLAMFLDNPIFGVGIGNFIHEYARYAPWNPLIPDKRVAHNSYLEVAAEQGIFGLLFFLLLLGVTYKELRKVERFVNKDKKDFIPYIAQAFQIGFMGLLMGNMFLTAHYDKSLWLLIGLAVAMKRLTLNHKKSISHGESWREPSPKEIQGGV